STLPDGARVLDAALRQFDGGVETVARDSDDRRDPAATRPTASGGDAHDEGGSRRVARSGGDQCLQAFTGRKGLDPLGVLSELSTSPSGRNSDSTMRRAKPACSSSLVSELQMTIVSR